ncbi:MAG: hypothetical protein ACRED1_00005 [Limisphaerales bacterium]
METKIETVDLAGAGQKLLAHSKSAEFTARRGLAVELYPFIYGASARMSAPAISQFLATEQGIQLSSVTINKAIKDPAKNWNLFFDLIEPAARTFTKSAGGKMAKFLFKKQYFFKPVENRFLKAAMKILVKEELAKAATILRTKWFNIDLEIRLKARPFLEHRLAEKGR